MNTRARYLIAFLTVSFLGCSTFFSPLYANPQDGVIAAGSASINQTDAKTLTIQQNSDKAIIDWKSFNIAADEHTKFIQPGSNSIILNRVTGGDVSKIFGQLSANGKVVLVNPAGIYFGPTARINVSSLVATTTNIKNSDFLAGNYQFIQSPGQSTSVINDGEIRAAAGLVALVAPAVANNGLIEANLGKVALASGNQFTVDLYGDQIINFAVNNKVIQTPVDYENNPVQSAVSNKGTIIADGGKIVMTANVAQNVVQNVINMEGVAQARTVLQRNGEIILSGGNAGIVKVSGKLDVSGKGTGQKGGTVKVLGQQLKLVKAKIDASGDRGGGTVLIGGNYQGKGPEMNATTVSVDADSLINISAVNNGNAGKAVVWSDDTTQFQGNILATGGIQSGNGGNVEVSGKQYLTMNGFVDLTAHYGEAGNLLLDPGSISIIHGAANGNSTNTFTDGYINQILASGNLTLSTSTATGGGVENITFATNTDINWNNTNTFTLFAGDNIIFNSGAYVTLSGGGTLNLYADINSKYGYNDATVRSVQFLSPSGNQIQLSNGSQVNIYDDLVHQNGSNDLSSAFTINDTSKVTTYTIINNIFQLQAIKDYLAGNYVLGRDINAQVTSSWNSGQGFIALGSATNNPFTGTFNGNNHIISNLYINNTSGISIGLFGQAENANIANVGLVNSNIIGANIVGGIVGNNINTPITNVYNSGSVSGSGMVGGLIGQNDTSPISNSHNDAAVTLVSSNNLVYAGGIAGFIINSSVNNVYNTGAITSTGDRNTVGGLFGRASLGNDLVPITNAYNTGSVTAYGGTFAWVGGLIGVTSPGTSITNAYNLGNVTGSANEIYIGGLVGSSYLTDINNTYTIGAITSSGGIVHAGGFMGSAGNVYDSYWNPATSGISQACPDAGCSGVSVLTTAQMMNQNSYSNNWSFSSVWGINAGVSLPYLQFRYPLNQKPQAVSGTLYNQSAQPIGANQTVNIAAQGSVLDTVLSYANGFYYSLLDNGSITSGNVVLAYTSNSSYLGNSVGALASSGMTGLNIYQNKLSISGNALTVANNLLEIAKGSLNNSNILYNLQGQNLTLNQGIMFTTQAGSNYKLNSNDTIITTADITTNGTLQIAGGTTSLFDNSNTSSIYINNTVSGTGAFVVNAANNIYINGQVGLTGVVVLNADNNINIGNSVTTTPIINATQVQAVAVNNITINAPITTTGSGDAVVLAARKAFINNAGSNAVTTASSGRFLIYSENPTNDVFGGLASGNTAIWNRVNYSVSPAEAGNRYIFAYQPTLTLAASDASKIYGNTINLSSAYTVSGLQTNTYGGAFVADSLAGSTVNINSSGASAAANVGNYGINVSLQLAPNALIGYRFVTVSGALTVTARPITITGDTISRTYGDANPTSTAAFHISSGNLVNGNTLSTVAVTNGPDTAANVGSYNWTPGDVQFSAGQASNYAISYANNSGTLSVTARPITITGDTISRTYGDANPTSTAAFHISSGNLVNGNTLSTVAVTNGPDTAANVGTYNWTPGDVQFSAGQASNYAISYVSNSGTLNVTARPITIAGETVSRNYGDANSATTAFRIISGDLVNGNTLSTVAVTDGPSTAANVGTYSWTPGDVQFNAGEASNYAISYANNSGTLNITARQITITGDTISRTYGDANPVTTTSFHVSGGSLANSDAFTGVLVNSNTNATTDTGDYNWTPGTLQFANGQASNYAINYVPGQLIITPRSIVISSENVSRFYGQANPNKTSAYYISKGVLVNNNAIDSVIFASNTTATTAPGSYDWNAAGVNFSNGKSSNYTFTYEPGQLTINPLSVDLSSIVTAPALTQNKILIDEDQGTIDCLVTLKDKPTKALLTNKTNIDKCLVGSYPIMPRVDGGMYE